MNDKIKHIIIWVVICLLIGFLSRFATQSTVDGWYLTLNKPIFNPPNWIFTPVWAVLYILMGIAAGIVSAKGYSDNRINVALYFFGVQLLFNALWSVVFFGFKSIFWALLIILVLLALILLTIRWFKGVSILAAYLLIPYFLWVCFTTALNYKIWEMN